MDLPIPSQDRAPARGDAAICALCGNTPAIDTIPQSRRLSKGRVLFSFVCGSPGCPGIVEVGQDEALSLHRAGIVASTGHYLKNVETVSRRTLHLMEHAENECDQIGAARVALAVEKVRLKAAGVLDTGPKVQVQQNAFISIEPGDPIDQRLERMAREEAARVVDAEIVPPAPLPPPPRGDDDEATGTL